MHFLCTLIFISSIRKLSLNKRYLVFSRPHTQPFSLRNLVSYYRVLAGAQMSVIPPSNCSHIYRKSAGFYDSITATFRQTLDALDCGATGVLREKIKIVPWDVFSRKILQDRQIKQKAITCAPVKQEQQNIQGRSTVFIYFSVLQVIVNSFFFGVHVNYTERVLWTIFCSFSCSYLACE